MRRTVLIICILGLIQNTAVIGQDRLPKNDIGFSAGWLPAIIDIYLDNPFNMWPDRENSYVLQISYARHFSEASLLGPYLEYEKARFSAGPDTQIGVFRRYSAGLSWLGKYPQKKLHMQLGGYFGIGLIRADSWDPLMGPDAGIIVGPAFETRNLGIALHFQMGHAWFGSSGIPEGMMLYSPRFLIKIYGRL